MPLKTRISRLRDFRPLATLLTTRPVSLMTCIKRLRYSREGSGNLKMQEKISKRRLLSMSETGFSMRRIGFRLCNSMRLLLLITRDSEYSRRTRTLL